MKAAMLQAVKDGHLITWPGLTEDTINKHLKLTPATVMGHMNQRCQNIRSTSKASTEKQQPPDTDLGTKTHLVYDVIVDQGQLYTDLTGKFPVRSSKGNSYVMLCYIYDCNYIKVVLMNSRSASEWVKAYDSIHQELSVKGFKPKLQTLDNEALAALKNFFTVNNIAYQLVPSHCHRHSAADRAIRNFKENFVAGLSSVDPSFPMHLWDRLLPQVEINSKLLSGPRDETTGLWIINLRPTNRHIPDPTANDVYELRNTGALVHYLHKALCSPTNAAMLQAVKDGHLITWTGLTEDAINKHLKLTLATAMGHMNQRRQNIRSTTKAPADKQQSPDPDLGSKTHLVYSFVADQGQLNTDLTENFPVRSSKGNSYVMVCYIYDCNYIKVVTMKSRSASEWVQAYNSIHQELTVKGFKPKLQTLDNEASTALKNFFTANDIAYQLVPPNCHQRNAAERAIRASKEHFVAGFSSVDPSFPMHLWDRLLPQAEITLNLLRTSRLHPQLLVAAHYHGLVDYNKTAFAPPGCKIIAYEKPGKWRTWAPHRHHGY
jgi:virulence-associated protein VapD